MALNVLLLEHAETLADLDRAQTYVVVFVQSEGTFYYWDGNSWEPTAGGGGGSLAIGEEVTGGLPGSVLYIDAAGDLGNDADFTFDPATGELGLTGSIDLSGNLGMVGDLGVTGAVGITGNVVVTGLFETSDDVEINGDLSLPTAASQITVAGTLTLSGSATVSYLAPSGTPVPTKINIPNFAPPGFGQIVAMGLPSSAPDNARVMLICDARTVAHQPSVNLLSPAENEISGPSWHGRETVLHYTVSSHLLALPLGSAAPTDAHIEPGHAVLYYGATDAFIRIRKLDGNYELITLPF
jgi:hypothetical protein